MAAESTDIRAFLDQLRRKMGDAPRPTPAPPATHTDLRAVAPTADLVERFAQSATSAGAEVHRTAAANWIDTVREALRRHEAIEVLSQPETRTALTRPRLREIRDALAGEGVRFVTATDDDTMFRVAASLTGVHGAIAETGSIVWESGELSARGATLIPPVHVALVRASQIVPDVLDLFERSGPAWDLPANLNIITGPSKTADIEGVLVTGVHGPGHVHVVVIEDE